MHIIKWSNDFALGIGEIDEQHKALVGMINALDASTHDEYSADAMRRMLDELNDYVKDHFGFEERLMGGGGCSPEMVSRHCGEHAYFRSVLRDLTADFENGRTSITVPLIEYLVHWLLHHIAVVDRAMARLLTTSEPPIAERVAVALKPHMNDDLSDSERHLLSELRRANDELEKQVSERTRELRNDRLRLEQELAQARSEIKDLRERLAAR